MGDWRLSDYVIHEFEDGELNWGIWVEYHGLEFFSGKAFEDCDTLLMAPWKVSGPAEEKTWEEVKKALESLPKWDRTTYWVKVADIGMSGLMDCKTLQPASEEEEERVMPKLGFTRSKV